MAISDIDPFSPIAPNNAGLTYSQLQELKADVRETFPELNREPLAGTGGSSITPEALEKLFDDVAALTAVNGIFTIGMMVVWAEAQGSIPAGWALADGSTQNGYVTTDMRDAYIVGAGSSYSLKQSVGSDPSSWTTVQAGSHDHNGNTDGTALSMAQMPSGLSNNIVVTMSGDDQSDSHSQTNSVARGNTSANSDFTAPVSATGANGEVHLHDIATDGNHTHNLNADLPPSTALFWIVYVGT